MICSDLEGKIMNIRVPFIFMIIIKKDCIQLKFKGFVRVWVFVIRFYNSTKFIAMMCNVHLEMFAPKTSYIIGQTWLIYNVYLPVFVSWHYLFISWICKNSLSITIAEVVFSKCNFFCQTIFMAWSVLQIYNCT